MDSGSADNLDQFRLEKMDLRELGRRLGIARQERGFETQKAAAKALRLSPSYVNSLELGKARPALATLDVIAAKYGMTREYFLSDTRPADLPKPHAEMGEIDAIALAALREIPPRQQRALLLDIWPRVREMCASLRNEAELVNSGNGVGN